MTIETKYNIGDEVWIVKGGKARVGHIQSLCFHKFMVLGNLHARMTYDVSSDGQILYHIDEIDLSPPQRSIAKEFVEYDTARIYTRTRRCKERRQNSTLLQTY